MNRKDGSNKQDGRYQITVTDAGVHLCVWPPAGGGWPAAKADITKELIRQKYSSFDSVFISQVIREAKGIPVLIITSQHPRDGRYQITVTDVGVHLSVWPPANGGKPVTRSVIVQDLLQQKYQNFDAETISRVIWEAVGTPVLIISLLTSRDGCYQITTSNAGAHLSVWPPLGSGKVVSKTAIVEELQTLQYNNFDSDFISRVIREGLGIPVHVAMAVPRKDGRHQIMATDAGVHLSVWPPAGGGTPVSKAAIVQELEDRSFGKFDGDFLSKVIREAAGVPVLIVTSMEDELPSRIRVKISPDRMEAMASFELAADEPLMTIEEVHAALSDAGVVFGIDRSVLEVLSQMRFADNMICAQGNPPVHGENAWLKYFVDPDSQGRPVELEGGRVDFKESNTFLCVEEGQLLVEKIPATAGVPGTNVQGQPVPSKAGKDVRMPVGKNVIAVDDWRLYAAIHGHLNLFLDKRVNVVPVIVVEGDVDYSSGNIDFKGSVIVKGSVQTDFCVKAGGNIEIFGSICGGSVDGHSIIVHKGIQGMGRTVIKAQDRLVANFIENATVHVDQDVIVSDAILNSTVFAGTRVIVEGKRGLIRGGRVSAGEVVRASTVGNPSGVVTEVEVSVNPYFKDELRQLRQDIKKAEMFYEELKASLPYMKVQCGEKDSATKRERYQKNETEFKELPERIEQMRQRIVHLEERMASLQPGRIRVNATLYPGVRVSVGSLTRNLNDQHQFVSLYAQDGDIKFASLK
ncbi:MAG TPA: FapA family protein [Patescibacteria group bacterium]|nr:FapA family protein [Patescibacteria group bacterium]